MEDEYMEQQDVESGNRNTNDGNDSVGDISKEFGEGGYEEGYEDEEGGNNFRGNNRMRGNFRNRGRGMPPPGWMNGPPPPMRFRGRGYGPSGPPMRGRGFFRGRGGPRGFNNGPNFDNNWGPMGPPPPGMMGGPPPFGPPPGMMPPGGPMGPPPNMMQPPPFGGPPGMPPPNMQPTELWVETKSDEGKSYYYHSRTRETTWTRPQDSATCKVVTQTEMEAMAAAGQLPGMGGPAMQMNGPMGGMGGPPMGGMPNGVMQGGPNAGMPPFMQPPPWVKEAASEKEIPRGDVSPDNDDSSSEQPMLQPPNGNIMAFANSQNPPNTTSNSLPGGPMQGGMMPMQGLPGVPMGGPLGGPPIGGPGAQMGGPGGPLGGPGGPLGGPAGLLGGPGGPLGGPGQGGPGGPMAPGGPMGGPGGPMGGPGGPMGGPGGPGAPWGGWGGWPPPLNNQPPGTMQQPGRVAAGTPAGPGGQPPTSLQGSTPVSAVPLAQAPKQETVMTPELQAAAAEWSTHRAPDGRPYYYNAGKHLSVWEKPPPLKQFEEVQAKIAAEKGGKPEPQIEKKMEIDESKIEVIDLDADDEAKATAVALAEAERRADAEREQKEQAEREQAEREKAEREKAEKEKADKEKAKQDRSRPISTTPISGTPWCVVWTGDGLVFFYNPTARLSVWERPAALASRADVDRAVAQPPNAVKELSALNNAAAAKASNGDKRPANTDSDSDVEPAKKTKQEEPKKTPVVQRADSSTEAEIAAAQQRAKVPFDIRAEAFTKLMVEKQVSAFSTWEKELHKIVFDQRYLMLNCKERKQVFDKFVRDRAEAERKEKRNRLQQMKQSFRQLMEEAKLHSKSSYSDFASKHSREERFKAIEKVRDREVYFNEYIAEVRKKEKEDREKKRDQAKTDFIVLLKEKSVDRRARWLDVKKKVDSDPRYKAVENSILREDYFREYCKIVKDERKKEKEGKEKEKAERERSSKKDKKDKDRDKDKEKEKDKDGKKDKKREKDADTSTELDEPKPEAEAETEAGVEGEDDTGSETDVEAKERAARAVKERAKEVQRVLANSLRDRDKERQHHQRDEAVQHFNALLADLVRNPDLSWRDAKKQLKKDHRYGLAELLSKDDKERLFSQHISAIAAKRRDKLNLVLNELGIACDAAWGRVKTQLREHAQAPTYSSSSQMEREFRDYIRDKQAGAKAQFRQLLQETRCLSHRSRAMLAEGPAAAAPIKRALQPDPRYTALDHIPEERQAIIDAYLEELEKKGPPPPPTATEPTRRSKQ